MALTLTDERLEEVIVYMKAQEQAEDPTERELIRRLCLASMIYLSEAPAVETEDNADLYWLVVSAMTLHAYDHRDEVGVVPDGVRPALNQIKLVTDYADSK